ncbi:hypothetical protein WICMUC_005390 [Wickerhamomyces mucosus]|uniref:Minichromosome loss protein Mcl1 middle region domain-containing protein n=1 Tax=Wickerhamomyces mucosus TaxID=1378264 RepID=A0A9P8P760_9ASCO|nr:hypothetical protein WICMUC_005390 [Wickerhamomyces mucosus]
MVDSEIIGAFPTGGNTFVKYIESGEKLIVAGVHGVSKIFKVDDESSEPEIIDIIEDTSSVAVFGNDLFATASKTGEAEYYSLKENSKINLVIRDSLALRDVAFTHNGTMLAAAGDNDEVQLTSLNDSSRVIKFQHGEQTHNLSYNQKYDLLSLSLSNGQIQIYSLKSERPRLIHTIKGEIPQLIYQDDDPLYEDNLISTRVEWSPNGDQFAIASDTKVIKVFSVSQEYQKIYSLNSLHSKAIIDLKWSPNGDYIAAVDLSNSLVIWDTVLRKPVVEQSFSKLLTNLSWGKIRNSDKLNLCSGSFDGDIFIFKEIVEQKSTSTQKKSDTSRLEELMAEEEEGEDDEEDNEENGEEADDINVMSERSDDEGDDGLDVRGFIVDDDGKAIDEEDEEHEFGDEGLFAEEGYQIPKRKAEDFEHRNGREKKHTTTVASVTYRHKPYSPGCTPYISGKRYLTINSVGYVSTVNHSSTEDGLSSVTVSFFDHSGNREYNFQDIYGYDLAAITSEGLLLAVSGSQDNDKAKIFYRSHNNNSPNDSWEKQIPLKNDEIITSISLSESVVLVCTSSGYIRQFTTYGIPSSIQKSAPILASTTSSNYIFTISLSNNNQLIYNLQDIEGNFLQRDLSLPLDFQPRSDLLKSIFFSTYGDPVIVGNDGVVLILSRWRNALQARWVPLLDTESKIKEIGGVGELTAWPLGLHLNSLNCIIIRGSKYPTFPLQLPTELEVKIPLSKEFSEASEAEEQLLRARTMGELLGETLTNEGEIFEDDNEKLTTYANDFDRAILKLFSQSCLDENNSKAWKLAQDLKQEKALEASAKMAERAGLIGLLNRINRLREQRMDFE